MYDPTVAMPQSIENPQNSNLVNYTSSTTPAPSEIYIPTTELPDSLAFIMKNSVLIQYSIPNFSFQGTPKNLENSTSLTF